MNTRLPIKNIIFAIVAIAAVVVAFLIHALAGLNARPVAFNSPPAFVEHYAKSLEQSQPSAIADAAQETREQPAASANITEDFSAEEELVRSVMFDNQSPTSLLELFRHPDKAQRIRVALAFAAINTRYTHDEASGFPEKRRQFWIEVERHLPDIENALFEALIASAKENTQNKIPYTLAWMPGQDHETVALFDWAAKHHSDPWIRRFCVYFVVAFGENEALASALLENRKHDPDYNVRKEVLDLQFRRLTGEI